MFAVVVDKQLAQSTRKQLEKEKQWDSSRKLLQVNQHQVAIPVHKESVPELQSFIIQEVQCPKSKLAKLLTPYQSMVTSIQELFLNPAVFESVRHEIPQHWEYHGDLVLFSQGSFVSQIWTSFGDELWRIVLSTLKCKRIARKKTICSDNFRSPQVELLHGDNSWVEHLDNKIRYGYDIRYCMFSVGNITEKLRVAAMNCHQETVVDLYAGIGYFTLPYLVHARAAHVHACEWNPEAVKALRWNLERNKVADRCTVYNGDNRQVCPAFIADRVNLGLVPSSEQGWPVACKALKHSGGVLHIHQNVTTRGGNIINGNDHKRICNSELHDCNQCSDSLINVGAGNSQTDIHNAQVDRQSDFVRIEAPLCNENGSDRKTSSKLSDQKAADCGVKSREKTECTGDFSECLCNGSIKSRWNCWEERVRLKICDLLVNVHGCDWTVDVVHIEHVKSYAPHVDHLVLDLNCRQVDVIPSS